MKKLNKLNTFTFLYAALAIIVGLYAIVTAATNTNTVPPPKLNGEIAAPSDTVHVDCPCCAETKSSKTETRKER